MSLRQYRSRQYQNRQYRSKQHQSGFTLLELMVAMTIFAVLAVAGWQVFDSVSRSKERAQIQFDVLTDLQYAYGQFQRDMMQTAAYQLPSSQQSAQNPAQNASSEPVPSQSENTEQNNAADTMNNGASNGASDGTQSVNGAHSSSVGSQQNTSNAAKYQPNRALSGVSAFALKNNRLSFVRYADPDPRYLASPALERVVYYFDEKGLVRERYTSLEDNRNEQPLQSRVIEGVTGGQFQVLLPVPSQQFPTEQSNAASDFGAAQNSSNNQFELTQNKADPLLPKGVRVSFNIPVGSEVTAISWVYALNKTPPVSDATSDANQTDP